MNDQEKLVLFDEGKAALTNGMDWVVWKDRLVDSGLSPKDIKTSSIEIIAAIDDSYGGTVQEELKASGMASKPENLHESVFDKIVERRTTVVQAELSQIISQQIVAGGQPAEVVEQNTHPLLDASVLKSAFRNANPAEEPKQEKVNPNSPPTIALGFVVMLGALGLPMLKYESTFYYGIALIGVAIAAKILKTILHYR